MKEYQVVFKQIRTAYNIATVKAKNFEEAKQKILDEDWGCWSTSYDDQVEIKTITNMKNEDDYWENTKGERMGTGL